MVNKLKIFEGFDKSIILYNFFFHKRISTKNISKNIFLFLNIQKYLIVCTYTY